MPPHQLNSSLRLTTVKTASICQAADDTNVQNYAKTVMATQQAAGFTYWYLYPSVGVEGGYDT